MTNKINVIREDVQRYFKEENKLERTEDYDMSESGLFYWRSEKYQQTDPNRNWSVCKIEIWETEKNRIIGNYIRNTDDVFCAQWLVKNKLEYLFLPESVQGQSIFSIEEKKLYSYYNPEEPFIWLGIYPSPDGNKVAVDGCYWGCPYELRVYDTTQLTQLPYPLIYVEHKYSREMGFVVEQWEDSNTLTIFHDEKGIVHIEL